MDNRERKLSIRTIIVILFAILLSIIGSFIIFINYQTGKNILFQFATETIQSSNNIIEQQILNFIQPAKENLAFGAVLIKERPITITNGPDVTEFLYRLLGENPNYSAIHWSDINGNMNLVEKETDNTFVNFVRLCDKNSCQSSTKILDQNYKVLKETNNSNDTFDPRSRPWYQKALIEKNFVLSQAYEFHTFVPSKKIFGVTAVYPIYLGKNSTDLLGMLSIDIKLDALSKFLAKLLISPNAKIFVFDDNHQLLATKLLANPSFNQTTDINKNLPWINAAFMQHQKNPKDLFFYDYQGIEYLAFFKELPTWVNKHWNIGIILPSSDIIGKWKYNLIISTSIAFSILFFGMVLVWFLSILISKPIERIANEAGAITSLDFSQIITLKTYIKEISNMQNAFVSMVQSLKSFTRYISFALVKKLMSSKDIAHVGGETKEITFLFSDINGFTALSENMNPQNLMAYLSMYFQAMTRIILKFKGTVDKYIGDGIMAFWNAPLDDQLHALHACESAILMQDILSKLNKRWQTENKPQITIRIGINTGATIVGNVGSEDRLSYTAVGDSVNLCSRLQDLNKIYGSKIIVSDATYNIVKNKFKFRLLDRVIVRGKIHEIFAYELLTPQDPLFCKIAEYNNQFQTAFTFYQQGNWDQAINSFESMSKIYAEDKLLKIYLERCHNFKNNPPSNWQGIWRLN